MEAPFTAKTGPAVPLNRDRDIYVAVIGTGAKSAPYFDLARGAWIPCAIWWDAATGEFRRREGPHGFGTWDAAMHAGRFLLADG